MIQNRNVIALTGPTGAIGMALIKCCLERNMEVIAIVNPNSKRKERLKQFSGLHVIECDMEKYCELDLCRELKNEMHIRTTEEFTCDIWIHLAWMSASGMGRNDVFVQNRNITFLLDAMDAANRAGCHTFLGAGSQAEYGLQSEDIGEFSETKPFTGYGIAKLCAGQLGRIRAQQLGIRFLWTRICSVYGPFDGENTMLISAISAMLKGDVPEFTKGEQIWDYLYSEDAANMLMKLVDSGKDGRVYVIGSGTKKPLFQYVECMKHTVEQVIGKRVTLAIGTRPYGENQVMHLCANLQAFLEDTGEFEFTSFEEGIRRTVIWCTKQLTD